MLHLDPADTYGTGFGAFLESECGFGWSLPTRSPIDGVDDSPEIGEATTSPASPTEHCISLPAHGFPVQSRTSIGTSTLFDPENAPSGSNRRQYSMDRSAPKLVIGADRFVRQLVVSGAHKYVEFRQLDATVVCWGPAGGGELELHDVPCSRASVFRDQTLSLAEKRNLMRVLKLCVRAAEARGQSVGSGDPDEMRGAIGAPGSEWRDTTHADQAVNQQAALETSDDDDVLVESALELFSCALHRLGLPLHSKASTAVRYALALIGGDDALASDGFSRLTTYLASLNKYGTDVGAALVPMYGTSEFPQAFARLAAVNDATYALRVGVAKVLCEASDDADADADNKNKSVTAVVTVGGQKLRCRALVVSHNAWPWPATAQSASTQWISRMTAVVDGVAVPEPNDARGKGGATALAVFPPGKNFGAKNESPSKAVTRVMQLSAATMSCPKGMRVLHGSVVSFDESGTAEGDLFGVLARLADTSCLRRHASGEASANENENKNETETETCERATEKQDKPKALWVSFHRDAVPMNCASTIESWSALPENVVTCPGPDGESDFAEVRLVFPKSQNCLPIQA